MSDYEVSAADIDAVMMGTVDDAPREIERVAPTERNRVDQIVKIIEDASGKISGLIAPNHRDVTVDRLASAFRLACLAQPSIMHADPKSIVEAVSRAASWGIVPQGTHHTGWFVLYGDPQRGKATLQLIPGYGAMISMAVARGVCASIRAGLVYEGDVFEWCEGTEPKIVHRPQPERSEHAQITHAYAIAHFRDAGVPPQFVVLDRAYLARLQDASRGSKHPSSPWRKWFEKMAMKSAVRRLFDFLPIDSSLGEAAGAAAALDGMEGYDDRVVERPRHRALPEADSVKIADAVEAADDPMGM